MRLIQTNLSLRDLCAHRSWQSASPNAARKHTATAKRNGFPRRFAQRDGGIPRFINLPPSPFRGNDRGNLYIAFSFTYWQSLKSGDPSVSFADSVSLRLGHGAALTCHRHVIHSRAAASLPRRGAEGAGASICGAVRDVGLAGRHRGRPLRDWLGRTAACLNRRGGRSFL